MEPHLDKRSPGRPPGLTATRPKDPERVRTVLDMKARGESFAAIGKAIGKTRAGARHIYNRWKGRL